MLQHQIVNKAVHDGRAWKVTLNPAVSGMFKRIFDGVDKVGQELVLADTPSNARNLLWFADRHPMIFKPKMRVIMQAALQDEREEAVRRILSGEYVPSNPHLALPPRDYQMRAVDLAVANGALLIGDEIGCGKTLIGIALAARREGLPAVIVTLTALPKQWQREFKKFAPELKTHVIKTSSPYPLDYAGGKRVSRPDVLIMSYSKLTSKMGRSWAEVIANEGLASSLVFDECHELRNHDTARYRAARMIRETASWCVGLTATPVINHGGEVFNVVDIVQPGALGDRKEFMREWCGKEADGPSNGSEGGGAPMRKVRVTDPVALGHHLRDSGVFIRRTRSDVGRELPPFQGIFHEVDVDQSLDANEAAEIEKLCRAVLAGVGGRGPGSAFKAAGDLDWKLRQATGVAKAMHVVNFVRLLIEGGERVVLYGYHHAVYSTWRKAFSDSAFGDLKPAFFTGEESPAKKEAELQRFKNKETPLLIISVRAGAGIDGIQYTGCRTVVFGEFDWSPGVMDQASGRVFRDGQPDPVTAYYIWANWGADPVMLDALNLKTEQSSGIVSLKLEAAELRGAEPEQMKKLAAAYLKQHASTPRRW